MKVHFISPDGETTQTVDAKPGDNLLEIAQNAVDRLAGETGQFREFVLPPLKTMIAMIHDEGAFCIKHSDGNLYPILEDIVSAGPDGINPVEPVAGMDLATVKRLVGDRVCITGNIDCAHLLPHGTPKQVREAVRLAIADAAPGGGYILTSSNSIHSSCRPENFVAMVRACQEFG